MLCILSASTPEPAAAQETLSPALATARGRRCVTPARVPRGTRAQSAQRQPGYAAILSCPAAPTPSPPWQGCSSTKRLYEGGERRAVLPCAKGRQGLPSPPWQSRGRNRARRRGPNRRSRGFSRWSRGPNRRSRGFSRWSRGFSRSASAHRARRPAPLPRGHGGTDRPPDFAPWGLGVQWACTDAVPATGMAGATAQWKRISNLTADVGGGAAR